MRWKQGWKKWRIFLLKLEDKKQKHIYGIIIMIIVADVVRKNEDAWPFSFLSFCSSTRRWVRAITLFPSLSISLSFFKIHLYVPSTIVHVWSFASNWNNRKTNERPFKISARFTSIAAVARATGEFLSVLINKSQRKSFLVALRGGRQETKKKKKCRTRDVWYAGDDIKGKNKKKKN